MKLIVKNVRWLTVIALSFGVIACSNNTELDDISVSEASSLVKTSLDVYRSRTCGCCEKWVTHVENSGFETDVYYPTNLNSIKADKGILPHYQSCHTAVSPDGFVFEGHIPADIIQRFLANPPPDTIGLAVPGMPAGSPGMEMGERHDEYNVLLLSSNGSHTVYERIVGKR